LLSKILSFFGVDLGDENTIFSSSRRKYARHPAFNVDVLIGNKVHEAYDWSMGGVSFKKPEGQNINVGDKVKVILTFKFATNNITITQEAHVVRSGENDTAVQFEALPSATKGQFQRVLESLYTQSFIESQEG